MQAEMRPMHDKVPILGLRPTHPRMSDKMYASEGRPIFSAVTRCNCIPTPPEIAITVPHSEWARPGHEKTLTKGELAMTWGEYASGFAPIAQGLGAGITRLDTSVPNVLHIVMRILSEKAHELGDMTQSQ